MNKGFAYGTIVVSMRYVLACQWSSDVKKSDHVGISAVRHCLSELPEHVGRLPWIADVEQMEKLGPHTAPMVARQKMEAAAALLIARKLRETQSDSIG